MKIDKKIQKQIEKEYQNITHCDISISSNLESLINTLIINGDSFCTQTNFPSIDIWRSVKNYDLVKFGVYIDSGNISKSNEEVIVLIGNTDANLYYDELKTHKVILMHGAKANIIAEKWGLVFVKDGIGCTISKTIKDNAKIL